MWFTVTALVNGTKKEITVKSQLLLKHWVRLCLPCFFKTVVSGKYLSESLYTTVRVAFDSQMLKRVVNAEM